MIISSMVQGTSDNASFVGAAGAGPDEVASARTEKGTEAGTEDEPDEDIVGIVVEALGILGVLVVAVVSKRSRRKLYNLLGLSETIQRIGLEIKVVVHALFL